MKTIQTLTDHQVWQLARQVDLLTISQLTDLLKYLDRDTVSWLRDQSVWELAMREHICGRDDEEAGYDSGSSH